MKKTGIIFRLVVRFTAVVLIQVFMATELGLAAGDTFFENNLHCSAITTLSPQLNFNTDVLKNVFLFKLSQDKANKGQWQNNKLLIPERGSVAHKAFIAWFLKGDLVKPMPEGIFCLKSADSGALTIYNRRPRRIRINVSKQFWGEDIILWPINDLLSGPVLVAISKDDFVNYYKELFLSWQKINMKLEIETDKHKKKLLTQRKNALFGKLFLKFIEFPVVGLYRPELALEKLYMFDPAMQNLLRFLERPEMNISVVSRYFYPISKKAAARGNLKIGPYLFYVAELADGKKALVFPEMTDADDLVLKIYDQEEYFKDNNIVPLAYRYYYFKNKTFSDIPVSLQATIDYVLQNKDDISRAVRPRKFRKKITKNGILSLTERIKVYFSKYPNTEVIVVPREDVNFGYVFFVYEAEDFEKFQEADEDLKPIGYFIADLKKKRIKRLNQAPGVEAFLRCIRDEKNIYGRGYIQSEFIVEFNERGIANVDPEKIFVLASSKLKK